MSLLSIQEWKCSFLLIPEKPFRPVHGGCSNSTCGFALFQIDPEFSDIFWFQEVDSGNDVKIWSFGDVPSGDEDNRYSSTSSA